MKRSLSEKISAVVRHPAPARKVLGAFRNRVDRVLGNLWCARRAITPQRAFQQITGEEIKTSFYEKFEDEFKKARYAEQDCSVKMGGAGDLELIYQLCEHIKAKKVIETGVAYGWSSLAILLSIKNREGSLLVSTDMPYSEEAASYAGCVVPDDLKENWKLIKKPDKEALPEAFEAVPEIDMCHYDSDKTYEGRMFAYPLLWSALRKGGIFISDDIGDNLAFKNFAQKVGTNPIVVKSNNKYVGLLVK